MQITSVDVHDGTAMRRWYAVLAAAGEADSPGVAMTTYAELVEKARGDRTVEAEHYWAGLVDAEMVGVYRLRVTLLDNLNTASMTLAVRPDRRHRGHGRELCAHAMAVVLAMGRHRIWVEVVEPLDGGPDGGLAPAARFAAAAGFRRALPMTRRVLELSSLDRQRLAGLQQEAQARAQGYRLVSWAGRCPDDVADDLAALRARMSVDAPLVDLDLEPESWDASRVRARDALLRAQGRTALTTCARRGADGPLVAFTDLGVTRHDPDNAYQWDTVVSAGHRGHRLGLLVKAANLRALLAHAPRVRRLHTWNADANTYMLAINDALGFVPLQREIEWQLDLPAP